MSMSNQEEVFEPSRSSVEREFRLAPKWREWRQRWRRGKTRHSVVSLETFASSTDTIFIYPDRFGNYDPQDLTFPEPPPDSLESCCQDAEPISPLGMVKASFVYLPQLGAQRPRRIPITVPPSVANAFRASTSRLSHPIFTYGALGFAALVALFATASNPQTPRTSVPEQASLAQTLSVVPPVASAPDVTARPTLNSPRRARHASEPEVIIHHYVQSEHKGNVRRIAIRRFSDLP
jgi:hypothetical protein